MLTQWRNIGAKAIDPTFAPSVIATSTILKIITAYAISNKTIIPPQTPQQKKICEELLN